ncbi:hypothetical protein KR084_011354 [Drosophila pseudotakahashii]|nr:hypothetical protein KR084_011354 [Drosophila pseudotakahashii]
MERIVRTCCLLLFLRFAAGSRIVRFDEPSVNKRILNYIIQHVNHSADPCEDFQNYASGHFADVHGDDGHFIIESNIRGQYNGKLETIFDLLKDRVFIDEYSVEEKVWRFYNTCLTAPSDTRSIKHYLELVSPGGNLTWPQFVPHGTLWAKQQFQWLETVAHLRRYGANTLISLRVEPDYFDNDKFSIFFRQPYLENMNDVDKIKDLLISSGVSSSRSAPLAKSIIKLNSDLQKLNEEKNPTFSVLTLEDIQNGTDIQLDKYLEILIGHPFESGFEMTMSDVKYFEGLSEVLENYDQEVVASYIIVQFSLFVRGLDGSDSESDSNNCVAAVAVQMELASDLLYKNYYLGQGKLEKYTKEIERIFGAVSRSFMARLEENRLNLTDDEVSYIQQKLLATTVKVGKLPNNVNHRRFVTNFYDDLNLDTDLDFASTQLKVLEHRTRRVLGQLKGPVPKGNSFYLLDEDQYDQNPEPRMQAVQTFIFVPYCLLQEPFFVPESHDVFKVSLLGFYLTRAMAIPLWTANLYYDSLSNYNEKLMNFTDNEGYINEMACLNRTTPSRDLQRRWDDVLSLQLIYNSYFGENSEFSQTQPAFTRVPLKKLFLINFAQWFVGLEDYAFFDLDDPDKMRLSEAVRNLPAFGEAFNCPKNALLNPTEKCEIW